MTHTLHVPTPVAVNYHMIRACNAACRFCFATFRDVPGQLDRAQSHALLERLREAGTQKLTFVGGEPTLHLHLSELVIHASELGMTTCVVSNGFRLERLMVQTQGHLDWVGLSVDASTEAVQIALGRSRGSHIADCVQLAERAHASGIRVKLNTVVTALNVDDDLSPVVRAVRPQRWKVFQVLPLDGQNDGSVEDLLISAEQFHAYVARHAALAEDGMAPIVEDNEAMTGSYAMIDPQGRFFGNATGTHVYSRPILDVGVYSALSEVGYDESRFEGRGGRYDWA